jgi:hypothetical protein
MLVYRVEAIVSEIESIDSQWDRVFYVVFIPTYHSGYSTEFVGKLTESLPIVDPAANPRELSKELPKGHGLKAGDKVEVRLTVSNIKT